MARPGARRRPAEQLGQPVEERGGVLVGEVYLLQAQRAGRYVADQQGLHLAFWLGPLHCRWHADALRAALRDGAAEIAPGVAWPLGNHDRPRSATRFGGGQVGRERALALATLVLGLPGAVFLYQGEELGLEDVDVPPEAMQDPVARRDAPERSRDPARTPLPWEPVAGWGFTEAGVAPWLPFGPRGEADTVAVQRRDPASTLHRYRALIGTRKAVGDLTGAAPPDWLDAPGEPVVAYRRGTAVVVANTLDEPAGWPLPAGRWRVAFDSCGTREGEVRHGEIRLAPRQAAILTG